MVIAFEDIFPNPQFFLLSWPTSRIRKRVQPLVPGHWVSTAHGASSGFLLVTGDRLLWSESLWRVLQAVWGIASCVSMSIILSPSFSPSQFPEVQLISASTIYQFLQATNIHWHIKICYMYTYCCITCIHWYLPASCSGFVQDSSKVPRVRWEVCRGETAHGVLAWHVTM